MSGIYEKVIKNTKKIESLLEEKLNAEGKGLYEKTVSIESYIEQDIVKKIRRIAKIRNKLMHEDGFELNDTVLFEADCRDVIYYLSTTEFNLETKPKTAETTHQPRDRRVCKSCGAHVIPKMSIRKGGLIVKQLRKFYCNLCGEFMYSTGGGHTIFAKSLLVLLIIVIIDELTGNAVSAVIRFIFGSVVPIFILIPLGLWYWGRKKTTNE